uniref:Thioredoxin domain containing 12 n=1 Tax=Macaca fascicularis TaxID=9541 RepID=A0A2K5UUC2_MACFA
METRPRLGATCLLGFSFLLLVISSDGHNGLGKGFGDHIHWRTLEDGKKEAAATGLHVCGSSRERQTFFSFSLSPKCQFVIECKK